MKHSSAVITEGKKKKKPKNRKKLILTACLLSTLKKSGGFLLLFMDYWDYRPVILIITVITGFQGLLTCNYTGLQARSYTD